LNNESPARSAVTDSVVIGENCADADAGGSIAPACRVDGGVAGDTRGSTSRA
jgi:hypothetical protein